MRYFLSLVTIASLAAQAAAYVYDVSLFVQSDNDTIAGKALVLVKEAEGIDNFAVGDLTPSVLKWDEDTNTLFFQPESGAAEYFSVENHQVQVTVNPGETNELVFEPPILNFNGSPDGFYAIAFTEDGPLSIVHYADSPPDGAIPLQLVLAYEATIHDPTILTTISDSTTTIIASKPTDLSKSIGLYSNKTTLHTTYTEWVTTCLEPTTLTLTTCEVHVCSPTTWTVTGPTTITVSGPKPEHTPPPGTTQAAPEATRTWTVAPQEPTTIRTANTTVADQFTSRPEITLEGLAQSRAVGGTLAGAIALLCMLI
ncbi:uncharacterized protein RJT20DRAFT_132487 [Scheffersomyces xylosifermentans]|uniref:uncharacterized protein n=1 Tax=Scheffersomyces xylosifermentans TaxID=1304137 RepID=UPI00315C75A2